MLEVLLLKYEAEMEIAKANIKVYLENPSGIGEHPDIVEALETQVRRYSEAREMYQATAVILRSFDE
jgi:hypothetical protein